MSGAATRYRALLLLGPTGSGKTPLGDLLQQRGLAGSRCLHFDFGANLRRLVERHRPDEHFGPEDLAFLRRILESGALLEDQQYPIAERVLRSFLAERAFLAEGEGGRVSGRTGPDAVIVLNGLPRHAGQADAVDRILDVREVVWLRCTAETALARIAANVGGDRGGREDDDPASVRRKLQLFHARTAPLLDHYRARSTPVTAIEVAPAMTAEQMWELLQRPEAPFGLTSE
jgi:adenylate kinase family enzyme